MSAHAAAHGEAHTSHSRIPYYIGVGLRLCLDAAFTFCAMSVLWALRTVHFWWTWPTDFAVEGWAKVLAPAKHLNLSGVMDAIGDNLWSWATLAFPIAIVVSAVVAFLALALFKKVWLGLGTMFVSTSLMVWFAACWGFQILGPLFAFTVAALVGTVVVIALAVWLLKSLWGLGKEAAH